MRRILLDCLTTMSIAIILFYACLAIRAILQSNDTLSSGVYSCRVNIISSSLLHPKNVLLMVAPGTTISNVHPINSNRSRCDLIVGYIKTS